MEGNNEEQIYDEEGLEFEDQEGEDFQDEGFEDYGGSDPAPLGGIYGLFKTVLTRLDSKKVSNLTNEELGTCNFTVRDCEKIALIAKTFRHPIVEKFFVDQSRIILDTGMSRKGWFTELFVTSKKHASRESSSSIQNLPQFQEKKNNKWKIFSKENQSTQDQLQ